MIETQMALPHKHVGSKISAKIKRYLLTRATLLCSLCYEIPCRTGGGGKLVAAALATGLEPAAPPVTC